MSHAPWTFEEATNAARQASEAQRQAENFMRDAFRSHAEAENSFRVALARKITELRAESIPATLAADLGRGDPNVARLRMERDIAEGVVEAAKQNAWRRAADRRDCAAFIGWSMKRELAENGAPVDDRVGMPA